MSYLAELGFRTLAGGGGPRGDAGHLRRGHRALEDRGTGPHARSCTSARNPYDHPRLSGRWPRTTDWNTPLDNRADPRDLQPTPSNDGRTRSKPRSSRSRNVNRTVGTMLGARDHPRPLAAPVDARRHGRDLTFNWARPGRAFGAFVPAGITLRLEGDANDYVGKGLSGGRIVVRPDRAATVPAEDNDHRRQRHRRTAPPAARSSCAAEWASGSACATPVRRCRDRGRGRPRLRVHDRRPGRGARQDRAGTSRRHVGWRRLRPRPDGTLRAQPGDGRWSSARRGRPGCSSLEELMQRKHLGRDRLDLSPSRAAGRLGRRIADRTLHARSCPPTTSGCSPSGSQATRKPTASTTNGHRPGQAVMEASPRMAETDRGS